MRLIKFLDIESTGNNVNRDEVIQYSGFLYDLGTDRILSKFDYYCWTDVPIHPSALAVHKIDTRTLARLSERKPFEYVIYNKMNNLLKKRELTFVSFNTAFDLNIAQNTLLNQGYDGIDFGIELNNDNVLRLAGNLRSNFCMYKSMKKNPNFASNGKLSEYANAAGLKVTALKDDFLKLCPDKSALKHSALFDAYILLRLFRRVILGKE